MSSVSWPARRSQSSLKLGFDDGPTGRHTDDRMKTRGPTQSDDKLQRVCEPDTARPVPWVVCHRHFDHGQVGLYAFSTEQRAYMHAARLIRDELGELLELDGERGRELVLALRQGRFQVAVELYHAIEGNLDAIDVTPLDVDQLHSDGPLDIPA